MGLKDGEDAEEHARRVSEIAWLNGAYIAAEHVKRQIMRPELENDHECL